MSLPYKLRMIRSYRYRLQMSERIGRSFEAAMKASNQIYNAALEERISAWRKADKSITKYDQFKSLTQVRADDQSMAAYAAPMLRTPIVQVNEAFKGFYARVKSGLGKAGFPRYRSFNRLRSFGFTEASGWTLKDNILRMKGLPAVRLKMHRPLEGEPLQLTVKRDGRGRWFAVFAVRLPDVFGPVARGALGLDLGVKNLATDSNSVAYARSALIVAPTGWALSERCRGRRLDHVVIGRPKNASLTSAVVRRQRERRSNIRLRTVSSSPGRR